MFFSQKVAKRLSKMGWKDEEISSMGVKNFNFLCLGLKANGYDDKKAADLFNRMFKNDFDAFFEMKENSGDFGPKILGPLEADVKKEMAREKAKARKK